MYPRLKLNSGEIFCHYSPKFKSITVLLETLVVISTNLDHSICGRKPFKVNLIDISKRELTPAILFCLDHVLFAPWGLNNAQFLGDSEPIRLLETARSLSEWVHTDVNYSMFLLFAEKPSWLNYKEMQSFKSREFKEGDKVRLTCEAEGKPTPVITWYKDGVVYTGRPDSGLVINPGKYDYTIQFAGLLLNDKGNFTCNVSNVHGWIAYSFIITVTCEYGTWPSKPQVFACVCYCLIT